MKGLHRAFDVQKHSYAIALPQEHGTPALEMRHQAIWYYFTTYPSPLFLLPFFMFMQKAP